MERQRRKLGANGLKECGEKIRRAIEENSRKPDDNLLRELSVNELEDFNRFSIDVTSNAGGSPASTMFLEQFPFPTTIHNCDTKFIELFFLFDSTGLTSEQRAWLLVYTELLFESPAFIDGELKSPEEVAKLYTKVGLSKDFLTENGMANQGPFPRYLAMGGKLSGYIFVTNDIYPLFYPV